MSYPYPYYSNGCSSYPPPDGSAFVNWYMGRALLFWFNPVGLMVNDLCHAAYVLQNPVKHAAEHLDSAQQAMAESRPFDAVNHAFFGMGKHGEPW